MRTLVYLEIKDHKIKESSWEAFFLAKKLTKNKQEDLAALLLGKKEELSSCFDELSQKGLQKLYTLEDKSFESYHFEAHSQALCDATKHFDAEAVIAITSPLTRDFLPRAAIRMEAGILTDLVSLKIEDGKISQILKAMYAGKVLAELSFSKNVKRKIISLRPKCFPYTKEEKEAPSQSSLEKIPLEMTDLSTTGLLAKESKEEHKEALDLSEADIIISGGRALGSEKNFSLIHDCAAQIGATPGASRAAVDSGYASHDMQVGQTGKTVNPKLYIASGISGSVQHMAGMRSSKVIVAINTDPEAPIFSIADYGVVADLFEALPLLSQKIETIQKES